MSKAKSPGVRRENNNEETESTGNRRIPLQKTQSFKGGNTLPKSISYTFIMSEPTDKEKNKGGRKKRASNFKEVYSLYA